MTDVKWTIKGREFVNCNCAYGCPCQFNALPTHGNCQAVVGMQIDQGHHGDTQLDGLRFAGIFRWPGAIHEGKGEAAVVIDERATDAAARGAACALSAARTPSRARPSSRCSPPRWRRCTSRSSPPSTSTWTSTRRKGRLVVRGVTEGRGEPIKNPVTGNEHRVPHRYAERLRIFARRDRARLDQGVAADRSSSSPTPTAQFAQRPSLPERHRR